MTSNHPLAELRALFRASPAFRRVLLSDAIAQLGDGGLTIALPMVVLETTHDVSLTGLAFSGEILAFGLLNPLGGALADRVEQKGVMIASNLVRVALLVWLLVVLAHHAPVAMLLATSLAMGAAGAFFVPARAAFLRRLLDGDALERAIALEGTLSFLIRLFSPPLMGALLTVLPASVGIGVDVAAYVVAAVLLFPRWVSGPWRGATDDALGAWHDGWTAIGRSASLRGLLAIDAALSLVGCAAFSTTVAFLADVLHLGAQANGYLLATTGLAGALGTQLARRVSPRRGAYAALAGAIALTYLLVPLAPSLPALMAFWSLRGAAIGVFGVLIGQRIAAEAPAEVAGRVQAAWCMAACLAAFAGSASTPWLLGHLGPAHAFTLFGVAIAGLAAVLALAGPLTRLLAARRVARTA